MGGKITITSAFNEIESEVQNIVSNPTVEGMACAQHAIEIIASHLTLTLQQKLALLKIKSPTPCYQDMFTPLGGETLLTLCTEEYSPYVFDYLNTLLETGITPQEMFGVINQRGDKNKHLGHTLIRYDQSKLDYLSFLKKLEQLGVPHNEIQAHLAVKMGKLTPLDLCLAAGSEVVYTLIKYDFLNESSYLTLRKAYEAYFQKQKPIEIFDPQNKDNSLFAYILSLPDEEKFAAIESALTKNSPFEKLLRSTKLFADKTYPAPIIELLKQELAKKPKVNNSNQSQPDYKVTIHGTLFSTPIIDNYVEEESGPVLKLDKEIEVEMKDFKRYGQ